MLHVRTIKSRLPIRNVRIVCSNHQKDKNSGTQSARTKSVVTIRNQQNESQVTEAATAELIENLIETIRDLEQRRQQSITELQMAAIEIGVLVASKVTYDKINADDYPIEELVNTALGKLDPKQPVTIRLNPQDYALLEQRFDGQDLNGVIHTVDFEEDVTLPRGSCHADTVDYGLVSTVDQRIDELRELLLQGLGDAQLERRSHGAGARPVRRFPDRRETA
ncbi:MAG: hypothetical protein KDB27_04840 [Planctomycetales bacterium]|nr:hypothetical protein [Planctomycetales bacterium]